MKGIQKFIYPIFFITILSFVMGGFTLFAHSCKRGRLIEQSIAPSTHCEQMAAKRLQDMHCDTKSQEKEKMSCHQSEQNSKPCCEDHVEFKSKVSVAQNIVPYQVFLNWTFLPITRVVPLEEKRDLPFSFTIQRPPPFLKLVFTTLFQQFLL